MSHLAGQDPSNAGWQQDLAWGQCRVGDALSAQGKFSEALEAYRKYLAIMTQLAEQAPANANWQQELAASYTRIGNDLYAQGQLDEALEAYQKGINIWQTLADQDPSNSVRQKNLSEAKLLTNADVAVTEVVPGSLAESLGIKVGDLLISYDGRKILNSFVLPYMMVRTGGEPREVRCGATDKK